MLSSSLKNEREYRERFSDRVNKIANKLESAGKKSSHTWGGGIDSNLLDSRRQSNNAGSIYGASSLRVGTGGGGTSAMSNNSSGTDANIGGASAPSASGKQNAQNAELKNACERANDIAVESVLGDKTQVTKRTLFGILQALRDHSSCDAAGHQHK